MVNDPHDLGAERTGGERWYEKRLWRRWQRVRAMPDYIAFCNKHTFDDDGVPSDFENILNNPEARQIMEKYGLLWPPHHDDQINKLSEDDMIELFGTAVQLMCPPTKQGVVPLVWDGRFNIRISDRDGLETIGEYHLCNHVALIIDICDDIPEAQIAAEVVELVRDLRATVGINVEYRGRESVGGRRKLSDELILLMREERRGGSSLVEITRRHWDQLASSGDRNWDLDELGSDIKTTSAYKNLQRVLG